MEIKLDTASFQRALKQAPVFLREEMADALDHSSRSFFKEFVARYLSGPPGLIAKPQGLLAHFFRRPLGSNDSIQIRAGRGRSTMAFMHSAAKTADMGVEVWSDSTIARAYQEGKAIKSGVKKLRVPFSKNISPFLYNSAGKLKPKYSGKRGELVPGAFQIKNRLGKEFIVEQNSRAEQKRQRALYNRNYRIRFLFWLADQRVVKKRIGFYETFDAFRPKAIGYLNKGVARACARFNAL